MRKICYHIVLMFFISFGCNNHSIKSKQVNLIISSSIKLNNSKLNFTDCSNTLRPYGFNKENIRVKIITNNSFHADKFVKLSIKEVNDSIWFNLEEFNIKNQDTLRISNFGGKKISKKNYIAQIKKTMCGFLNK